MDDAFDFEKLEVYILSLDFLDFVFDICDNISRDLQRCLGDNFRRAVISISNNIAEGSGKKSKKEKAKFYGISFNSTRECVNMFNVLKRRNTINEEDFPKGREYARRITSMLYRLIKTLE